MAPISLLATPFPSYPAATSVWVRATSPPLRRYSVYPASSSPSRISNRFRSGTSTTVYSGAAVVPRFSEPLIFAFRSPSRGTVSPAARCLVSRPLPDATWPMDGLFGVQSEHSPDRALRELLVMGRLARDRDHHALERSPVRLRDRLGGRTGRNRPLAAPRLDQGGAALDQHPRHSLHLAADGVVLVRELDPEGHHHPRHVAPAIDRMAAGQGEQRREWVGLSIGRVAHLAPPRLVDPLDHRAGEIGLVLELVIERAAGVPGLTRHLLEPQVSVAIARQSSRRRFQQRASRARPSLGLGRPLGAGRDFGCHGAHGP